MEYNENEEEVMAKGKMIAVTTLSVIGVITLLTFVVCFVGPKLIDRLVTLREYRVLKITDDNREQIIKLLEQEKEHIGPAEMRYCDSMYKIEFTDLFPDGTDYTIYCKEEKNISLGIDKVGEDVLHTYIEENGYDSVR